MEGSENDAIDFRAASRSGTGKSFRPEPNATAASTAIVSPPRIGLMKVEASTCRPPSTKHDKPSVSSEPPEIMTNMKAPISQDNPMLGSTLANGVINAPAIAASPQPMPNVIRRTRVLSIPNPCASVSFMMTARVERPSRVPLRSPVNSAAITIAAATISNR